ncbi:MAG: gamma carbonic anhydrase family protein [Promethearchaeota archaeon]
MAVYAYGRRKPKVDPSAWIHPRADVTGKVFVGPRAYVGSGAVVRGDYGTVRIGEGAAIEENVTIHARPSGTTTIERDVTVGHGAVLHNCTLREGCVVGMNAVVTDYAEVGAGAIIGEGSVVKANSKVAPGTVAVGVPAREVGPVKEKVAEFWKAVKVIYQDLAASYPSKLRELSPEEYRWEKGRGKPQT